MTIFKRSDFYREYNNDKLLINDDTVLAYAKPTGALCEVFEINGTTSIMDETTTYTNVELSNMLCGAGIRGRVIIHHLYDRRNIPRWLNYHIHNRPMATWMDDIKIYALDQGPTKPLPICVETVHPFTIPVKRIATVIDRHSQDNKFDGLYIEAEVKDIGKELYHFLPTRYTSGVVKQVLNAQNPRRLQTIVEVDNNGEKQVISVNSHSRTIRNMVSEGQNINGRHVTIQYTTYVPGDRLSNFSAPAVIGLAK